MVEEPDSMKEHNECECKVGTVIKRYELESMNDNLVARWTGQRGDSEGTRGLANQFNRRLLRAEMRAADMDIVEGRVENLHRLLTDDDALEAVRIQARDVLGDNGINVERLENDFVSHQTIYRHLRNCLDVEKEHDTISVEKERDRINRMQNRAETVIDDGISRLRDGDKLTLTDFEVLINFRVTCEECGELYDASELINRGGCKCQI
jgi:hypothetical protein